MSQRTPDKHARAIAIGLVAGPLFAVCLYVAAVAIPAATRSAGHYNIGNELLMAVFFSYALFTLQLTAPFGIAMYVAYVYVAVARKRRIGLALFAAHYLFATVVALPFFLHRDPGLPGKTAIQFAMLRERPLTLLFCLGPFFVANLWYLIRLLRR